MRDVLLFDLDGTVLDTYDAILDSMRYATRKVLGEELPDDVLLAEVGKPLVTQMRTFAPDEDAVQTLLSVYRARNEHDLDQKTAPFPGIEEVVKRCNAKGFVSAIVTSKRQALATKSLRAFGMHDLFARVNGMESSTGHKPDPDPLVQAALDLDVSLDRCLYIGDSPYDIQAAHAAHIPVIAVTWGKFFDEAALAGEHPTRVVRTCEDLYDTLCEVAVGNVAHFRAL